MTLKDLFGTESVNQDQIYDTIRISDESSTEVDGVNDLSITLIVCDTGTICYLLDKYRMKNGKTPLFVGDNIVDSDWYEIRMKIHRNRKIVPTFYFVELYYWISGDREDYEYTEIDLTSDEQKILYDIANDAALIHWNTTLKDLFKNERKNLKTNNMEEH